MKFLNSIVKALIAVALLTTLSACVRTSNPDMMDYSYVPTTQAVSVQSNPGIQDF